MNAYSPDTSAFLRTFPTGFGQSDTRATILNDGRPNPSPLAGTPYATITSRQIVAMLANPQRAPKEKARWFIPSTYAQHDARSSDAQRERGQYLFLPIDIDDNDLSLEDVVGALNAVVPGVSQIVYSSRSAKASDRRWRALVPLAAPLAGLDYRDTQEALFEALEAATAGVLIPCRGFLTPAQPVYLPNAGEHYEKHAERGQRLDLTDHLIARLREQRRAERAQIEREAQQRREQKARERAAKASDDEVQPVDHFNDRHTVEQLLGKYGYQHDGGGDWRSPMQSSGSFATRNYGDYWISLSATDAAAEIGAPSKSGHRFGDAFDLFVHFEHGGKFTEAVRAYAQEAGLDGTQQQYAGGAGFDWRSKTQDDRKESQFEEALSGPPRKRFINASSLSGKPIPSREWLVENWIPKNTVTTLYGDGGTGKSLAAGQLAVSTALSRPWLGLPTMGGRALYLSAEDDMDELHRRLADIVRAEGTHLGALTNLEISSLAGEDALLAGVMKDHSLKPTPLFAELEAQVAQFKPVLVVADTLADFHPANENERAQARQFIGIMRGLAIRQRCSVLLLAHPSLTGLNSGTGTSGSTAWNNSVRSRLYMQRLMQEGYEPDVDARTITVMKSNYARIGTEVRVRWQEGVFVADQVDASTSGLGRLATTAKAERVFLKLLGQYTAEGRYVSAQPGPTYAPTQFASNPAAEGCTKRALKTAMDALFTAGKIVMATHGSGAKARSHIAEAGSK